MSDQPKIRHHVNRPRPSATWEYEHRWGTALGDTTPLKITRRGAGHLVISYGDHSVEVRPDLVPVFAEMIATAAAWSDEATE